MCVWKRQEAPWGWGGAAMVKMTEAAGRLVPAASRPVFSQQAAGWDPGRSQGRRITDDILTLLLTSSHSLSQPAAAEPANC